MRKYLYTGLVCSLLSAGAQLYLAKRSYTLKAGSAGPSQICSISEKINCDSALLSTYGEIFGMSLSNLGFAFNFIFFLILLGILLNWMGAFWRKLSVYIGGFIAFVSIVMTVISFYQNLYCPLCWVTYLLSYISFFAVYKAFEKSFSFFFEALKDKRTWLFGGLVFVGAFFLHMSFITALGLKNIEASVKAALIDWRLEETFHFTAPPSLTSGPKQSFMNIVEFADFLCPHCKKVHPYIEEFLKIYPQASFVFYAYPLDSQCNKSISFSNNGLSCYLAKLSFCAKQQNKTVAIHSLIFNRQKEFLLSAKNPKKLQKTKDLLIKEAQLQKERLLECLKDKETLALLSQQIEEGIKAKIPGTPSVFVNGKRLRGKDVFQTLQALYRELR